MATSAIRMNLSGSTDGKPIKIATTGSPGTLVHTATSNSTPGSGGIWDEIWLWCYNSNAVTVAGTPLVRVEFGGTTSPDNKVEQVQPSLAGAWLICAGLILQNGLVVRVFAGTANTYIVYGFVNRITNA